MPTRYELDIEHTMFAIFTNRHPGLILHPEDRPYYRNAAIAALKALGVIPADELDTVTVAINEPLPIDALV